MAKYISASADAVKIFVACWILAGVPRLICPLAARRVFVSGWVDHFIFGVLYGNLGGI